MTLTHRNGVSIAEIIVYIPALAVAAWLSIRHGFGRSSGWIYLNIFCLARIIGPCMQLATISSPNNVGLYTGSSILSNIGLSPLELAALGLLSRVLGSINKSHSTFIGTHFLKLIQVLVTVGLILGIVGGINASDAYQKTGTYQPGTLNKAGTALLIASYVALVFTTIITYLHISHAERGEKRLLVAIAISLPFFLVRLVYSIFATFTHNKDFNLLDGNLTVLICVSLIEEFIIVLTYEIVGLTLQKATKEEFLGDSRSTQSAKGFQQQQQPQNRTVGDSRAMKIAKKTIIGKIVMAAVPSRENDDLEMDRPRQYRRGQR